MVRAATILIGSCLVLASCWTSVAAQDDEKIPDSRIRGEGELTFAPMFLKNAYFDRFQDFTWLEAWLRYGVQADVHDYVMLELGAAAVGTVGADPYGVEDDGEIVIEKANVVIHDFVTGLSFTLGRQNFNIGDGFFLEDGVSDDRGAAWNIPLRYWDGARADYIRGRWGASAFAFDLSDSFGPQKGTLAGGHVTWCPNEEETPIAHAVPEDDDMPETYAGAGVFQRFDDGEEDNDASLAFARASAPAGPVVLSGEFGKQFGESGGVDLGGYGYHVDATIPVPVANEAYARASWFQFTGDDPDTDENETFFRWNYTSRDWSLYYLGEIVGSTLLENSDQRAIKIEAGFQPTSESYLRAYYLRCETDQPVEGAGSRHAADEVDVAWDWVPEEVPWAAWAVLGFAWPGDVGKALAGSDTTALLSLAITRYF